MNRDLLILAGDVLQISNLEAYEDFFHKQLKASPILWIMGNHEFYDGDVNDITDYSFQKIEENFPGLKILDNEIEIVNEDLVIIGSTYWTDMNNNDEHTKRTALRYLNDFNYINYKSRKLHPEDTLEFNQKAVKFIDKITREPAFSEMQKIIVTHHAPSYKSVALKYLTAGLGNYCYISEHDSFVETLGNRGVTHWIHGHTHTPQEYTIGNTTIISNPIGYPRENYNIPSNECYIYV